MYKLENNVQWTEDLKEAFKHGITKAKIICNGNEINYDNGLVNVQLEDNRYVPGVGFIGQATAKKVTLNLLDNEQAMNLENQEFSLYIGADYEGQTYYINYGNFIVNAPPENDSTNGTIKIVAYDYMIKFNKDYISTISYPCTLKQLLQNICTKAEVQLGTTDFANMTFSVENNQFENKKLREVLQNIAKCAFSWARIGQDNKLYLDFYNDTTVTEEITMEHYFQDKYKKANEYYGAINKVTYAQSDIIGQEESVEDAEDIQLHGVKELVINDNYFAYTNEKRRQLVQKGTRLFGLKYMPIQELETIGLIYLDCRDIIKIYDEEGNSVTTRVFSHTIRYNGVTSDSIQTEAKSINEQTYSNKNTIAEQTGKTEFMVDRANKLIQSTTETVTEQNNKISQISQTVTDINSKISDIADTTVSQKTFDGHLEFTGINQSEPINIEIYPTGENISFLYPFETLFPANDLYIKLRTIRFKNTTTNEVFDYELPNDLLYYDSEHYDTFALDYKNQTVTVVKKCKYNPNTGAVELLNNPTTLQYTFPQIYLTDGDYTVKVLKYDNTVYPCYLFVRLMAKNIYTTQFTTRVEFNTKIDQTVRSIDLSVNAKFSNYSTTQEMNSAINLKANEITASVSENYATKTQLGNYSTTTQMNAAINLKANEITTNVNETYETKANASNTYATKTTTDSLSTRIKQTAKTVEITAKDNSTSAGITIKLKNEDGTQIDSKSANITLSGLVKFTDLSTSGSTTINGANITTGTIDASKVSVTKLNASNITTGTLDASKVTVTNLNASNIKSGTLSADKINGGTITASAINLGSGKFAVTSAGVLTATSGTIGGWGITSTNLYTQNNNYEVGLSSNTNSDSLSFYVWDRNNNRANFAVRADGYMYARNADISGIITATSGVFDNCTVKNTCNIPAAAVKSGTFESARIPNLSASKITSGTMSGDRISGGTISGSNVSGLTVSGDIVAVHSQYGHYEIGDYTGQTFNLIVNDGEKGWRRLRFRGGILIGIDSSW